MCVIKSKIKKIKSRGKDRKISCLWKLRIIGKKERKKINCVKIKYLREKI